MNTLTRRSRLALLTVTHEAYIASIFGAGQAFKLQPCGAGYGTRGGGAGHGPMKEQDGQG